MTKAETIQTLARETSHLTRDEWALESPITCASLRILGTWADGGRPTLAALDVVSREATIVAGSARCARVARTASILATMASCEARTIRANLADGGAR